MSGLSDEKWQTCFLDVFEVNMENILNNIQLNKLYIYLFYIIVNLFRLILLNILIGSSDYNYAVLIYWCMDEIPYNILFYYTLFYTHIGIINSV